MMGLTVNEALSIEVMSQTKIIAGRTGLDREIIWVTVIEVLDEIHLFQEGELLITTAFGLTDIPSLVDELIPQLVQRKLAGLAIQTGYYLDVIPATMIQQCNHYNFPLLELPKEVKFSELTMAITKRIINRQMERLEYAQRSHDRLTQVLLENKGLPQIATALAELISAPVRILDVHFNILTSSGLEENSNYIHSEKVRAEYQALKKHKLLPTGVNPVPMHVKNVAGCPDQFLQPLIVGKEVYGFLSVLTSKPTLEDMERIAISSAATISILEILKEKAVWETEERVKGDFIDDLIENNIQTDTMLRRRANYLGFNLEKEFVTLTFQFANLNTIMPTYSEVRFQQIKQRLFTLVQFTLHSYQKQALLKYKNNKLVVLLQVNNDSAKAVAKQEMLHTAELLGKTIAAETAVTTSIGIGRTYKQLSDMAKSFQEAEQALSISHRLRNNNCVLFYEDLGPYILFANRINETELQNYYTATVSAIIDYDSNHKSELVATLEAFMKCNNTLKETANELFIHRHTLKYRLRRIHEITGLDPENAKDQFQLQLGLIVARLLSKG
jgi:purine catabolism regulator